MKHRLSFSFLIISLLFFEISVSASVIDKSENIDTKTLQKLDQGKSHVDVIVLLTGYKNYVGQIRADKRAEMAISHASIHSKQDAVLQQLHPSHFILKHRFENIHGFSARLTQEGIQKLASLPEVAIIEADEMVEAHLAQGIPLMNASVPRSTYNGTGLSVAVVDTGIDYNHSMLGGGGFPNAKVIGGYDFGDDDANPIDCHGHGTSVAGIAAGTLATGPGDYVGGVAHNAKLYALKIVSGCEGSAGESDIIAAWDWAFSHKFDDPDNPILIINTSFGGGKYLSACDSSHQSLAAAANNAVANGITLFGSSGNDAYVDGISFPACLSNSISVGAVYDANVGYHGYSICSDSTTVADKVTCYSNSADFLDILAPSHDAYTTAVGGGYTSSFGGTSAASPYAAGVGALVQSYAKSVIGSYYSSMELKAKLLNGDPITDQRNNISKPRVNADTALEFTIFKTAVSPVIDGDLSEYSGTESFTLSPSSGGNTVTVKALWDDEALYLAYEVTETQLNASVTTRDGGVWNEDSVEWGIDTQNNDGGSGNPNSAYMLPDDYHGIVNILNTQYDSQGTVSGSPSSAWNGNWQSAVLFNGTNNNNTDTDIGYKVEVKIPWTTLGYSSAPAGDTMVRMGFLLNDKDASSIARAMWPQGGGTSFQNAANWGEVVLSATTTELFTIDGNITTDAYDAVRDVIMNGASCSTTDANGYYSCVVPSGWSGTITPSKHLYTFDPPSRSYGNVTSDYNDDYIGIPQNADIVYVEPAGSCGPGNAPCYDNIQDAVFAVDSGGTVKVAQGEYRENIQIQIESDKDVIIQGGWISDFSMREEDPSLTVVNGDINNDGTSDGPIFYFDLSYNCCGNIITMEDLTIRKGFQGILLYGGDLNVFNSIIVENDTGIEAILISGTLNLSNNRIVANNTGLHILAGSWSADSWWDSVVNMNNNFVVGNDIGVNAIAGGTDCTPPWATISLLFNSGNNTISGNNVGIRSSAYPCFSSLRADLRNDIVWGNSSDDIVIIRMENWCCYNENVYVSASYSDIGNVNDGIGGHYSDDGTNLNDNPLFVDSVNEDYHLSSSSHLINQGDNRSISSISNDFEGDPRRMYYTVDIGADEYSGPIIPEGETCDDEIDNDGDSLIDCDDSECTSSGDLLCAQGELTITKTAGPDPVYSEDELTYRLTVTYTNIQGPDYVTGVTVIDELPSSVSYVSAIPSKGTCEYSNGIVTCDLGAMNNGSSATIDIKVIPPVAGSTVDNTASVTSDISDPYSSNNSASISTFINFVRYVKEGGSDAGDCTNPASPCVTIQYAVNQSTAGDKVRVARGTYRENIDLGGVVSLTGGWNSDFSVRNADPRLTIIDGDSNSDGISDGNVISSNIASSSLIIDGLTIKSGTYGINIYYGCYYSPCPPVSDSIVTMTNNILNGNNTGININVFAFACSDFDANLIVNLSNNIIYGNNDDGIYGYAHSDWNDCGGWNWYHNNGYLTINSINNTISTNSNGIRTEENGELVTNFQNDIIWGNSVNDIEQWGWNSTCNTSYSDIGNVSNNYGTYNDDMSNFNVDPSFVDTSNGNYHLSSYSPLINKGSHSASSLPATDFEGDPRIINCTVDIGADEVQPGTGLWHEIADTSTPAGRLFTSTCTESWWYGQDSTGKYNTGSANAGTLTTPPYDILTDSVFSFWSWEDTENSSGYDTRKVYVSTNSGATWQEIENLFGTENQWYKVEIPLESYIGQTVMFKFTFDTVDVFYNDYAGWYLDEIKVEECSNVYYRDYDADSYGDPNNTIISCTLPPRGYVSDNTDCDDTNPSITSAVYWYPDSDGDSYGNSAVSVQQCTQPAEGWVTDNTDYNDNDANIYPGGPAVRGVSTKLCKLINLSKHRRWTIEGREETGKDGRSKS